MDSCLGVVSWLKPRSLEFKCIGITNRKLSLEPDLLPPSSYPQGRKERCTRVQACVCVCLSLTDLLNTIYLVLTKHEAQC